MNATETKPLTMRQLRATPVRDLTMADCRRLLVHHHGGELTPERRRAYLFKSVKNAYVYFNDAEQGEIKKWIAEEGATISKPAVVRGYASAFIRFDEVVAAADYDRLALKVAVLKAVVVEARKVLRNDKVLDAVNTELCGLSAALKSLPEDL